MTGILFVQIRIVRSGLEVLPAHLSPAVQGKSVRRHPGGVSPPQHGDVAIGGRIEGNGGIVDFIRADESLQVRLDLGNVPFPAVGLNRPGEDHILLQVFRGGRIRETLRAGDRLEDIIAAGDERRAVGIQGKSAAVRPGIPEDIVDQDRLAVLLGFAAESRVVGPVRGRVVDNGVA